jgi:hypothetical protein
MHANQGQESGFYDVKVENPGLASGEYLYGMQVRPLDSAIGRDSKSGAGTFVDVKKLVVLRCHGNVDAQRATPIRNGWRFVVLESSV